MRSKRVGMHHGRVQRVDMILVAAHRGARRDLHNSKEEEESRARNDSKTSESEATDGLDHDIVVGNQE